MISDVWAPFSANHGLQASSDSRMWL